MHFTLEGPALDDAECNKWIHRFSWACLSWLHFNPSLARYDRESGVVTMPIRRVNLSGYTGSRFLGIFRVFTPDKMTRLPATMIIRHVLDMQVVGREPAVDKWVTVDPAIFADPSGVICMGPEAHLWDRLSGLDVKVSALSIEIIDDEPK